MIIGIACALLPVRELRSMIDNRVRVLMDRWSLELSGDVRMRDCGGLGCVGKSWSVRARGARADQRTRMFGSSVASKIHVIMFRY